MKTRILSILAGVALTALVLSACGGSQSPAVVDASNESEGTCLSDADCAEGLACQEGECIEPIAPEDPGTPPDVAVDCAAEGFCEVGHACSDNAECASDKCELTVGLCIESCNAGFTFWTANGNKVGTCIPTPLPPPPAEAWM